jgi:hypothetical protein
MRAEGWYRDPFELHTDRWFSDGRPTVLVRDGEQESNDPPPAADYAGPLTEGAVDVPTDSSDLLRADDPSSKPFDVGDGADAVIDRAISINSGLFGRGAMKNLPNAY